MYSDFFLWICIQSDIFRLIIRFTSLIKYLNIKDHYVGFWEYLLAEMEWICKGILEGVCIVDLNIIVSNQFNKYMKKMSVGINL